MPVAGITILPPASVSSCSISRALSTTSEAYLCSAALSRTSLLVANGGKLLRLFSPCVLVDSVDAVLFAVAPSSVELLSADGGVVLVAFAAGEAGACGGGTGGLCIA